MANGQHNPSRLYYYPPHNPGVGSSSRRATLGRAGPDPSRTQPAGPRSDAAVYVDEVEI